MLTTRKISQANPTVSNGRPAGSSLTSSGCSFKSSADKFSTREFPRSVSSSPKLCVAKNHSPKPMVKMAAPIKLERRRVGDMGGKVVDPGGKSVAKMSRDYVPLSLEQRRAFRTVRLRPHSLEDQSPPITENVEPLSLSFTSLTNGRSRTQSDEDNGGKHSPVYSSKSGINGFVSGEAKSSFPYGKMVIIP